MEGLRIFLKRIQKVVVRISDLMELIIALAVAAALIIAAFRYIPTSLINVLTLSEDTSAFYTFLEQIFLLVIGIEFIKMLCQPDPHNVIEVLLFLVARHMIVGHNGAVDNLLSVISITILFVVERYLREGTLKAKINKDEEKEEKH